ncbi:DNA repair protein RadA domain protein [uncultured Coleofasciculus sp.]|uniref:DNA repair protein RadA domain protein n=1 Tax=uncultured Coleofasciculus sp. TaxID=1267456 RepID=A0A6J4HET5_9CYAN|nr:DNA repair protein RadA domain protein [uncultured Coleofasciculus sp.]
MNLNPAPQTVRQTIEWLKRLGRPPLPECPIEAAKQGKQPKQPCFLDGRYLKTVDWKTWQDAMPLPEIIDAWFANPRTGVGTLGGFNGQHWLGWVDFDVKVFSSQEECDHTIATWQEQYPILKTTPRFRTPSGGYRFLIAWESEPVEFKANSKFTLEPEGAVMGELLTKNGAHTLLPPTISINGSYYWESWAEYPPITSKPMDVGLYPVKNKQDARASRSRQRLLSKLDWTDVDWARSYLAAIPDSDLHYEDWLRIGMALHSVDDSLLPDWVAWSQTGSKYQEGECEKKWASFTPNGAVGIGTLADLAKQSGWVNPLNSLVSQSEKTKPKPKPRSQLSQPDQDNSKPVSGCPKLEEQRQPVIQLDPGQLNSILSRIEVALGPGDAPRNAIYVQGSHDGFYLSRVLKSTLDNRSQLIEISKDVDTLDFLTPESLQYEFNRRFRFERYDARKEDYKPVDCPRTVASQFLQKGRWPQLPRLTGISYIPLLCKDGTVINQPGYHKPTGILLQFDPDEFPAIPERPTKENAIAALSTLIDWLKEFPFQTKKHRSAALSAVLTAVCRKLLKQAPLHAISATKAGSGKGTLAKGVSILLLDSYAGTIPFTGDSEEFRKKITSFLKSGQPIGLIDNVTGVLGGDVLEMVLTEPFFKDRLLGGNQIPSFSTQTLQLANGNNLRFRPDMTRRTILCVLDSQLENPEHRTFARDFEEFTHTNRGKLVAAALTILKAYIVAGSPDRKQPKLGSFEGWSDLVRSSLTWLGQPDPVETQAEIAAQDDERQTLLALLQSWYDSCMSIPKTAKEVCLGAIQTGRGDLRDVLLEIALDRKGDISPRKLGYYLRSHCRSVISGLRFETAGADRLGTTRWKVTVVPHAPKPSPASPASPAKKAETTQSQADGHAGDRFSSPAFAPNGKSEDTTVQEIDLLSPAPSNNGKTGVRSTSAGDAGDSSSHPTQTVSSEADEAGVSKADLANGHSSYLAVNDSSIAVGSTVNKKGKRGWVGKVTKREGDIAEVLWTGDRYPTRIPVSELKLAA